jgi:hypothetical protein
VLQLGKILSHPKSQNNYTENKRGIYSQPLLVLLEAGKPKTKLQRSLSQIKISPQEPQLITP